MDVFINILGGLTIGVQLTGLYLLTKILLRKETPTLPYIFLLIGMLIILLIKLDFILHFLNPTLRLILQFGTSVTLTIGFGLIYKLLKLKFNE